jgi:hypothetical protein
MGRPHAQPGQKRGKQAHHLLSAAAGEPEHGVGMYQNGIPTQHHRAELHSFGALPRHGADGGVRGRAWQMEMQNDEVTVQIDHAGWRRVPLGPRWLRDEAEILASDSVAHLSGGRAGHMYGTAFLGVT